jgi:hypothetical protein
LKPRVCIGCLRLGQAGPVSLPIQMTSSSIGLLVHPDKGEQGTALADSLTRGYIGRDLAIPRPTILNAIVSSLSVLIAKAEASLPDPTPTQRELLAKLVGVQTRIEEGRLRVAVLGQFKRGKSTLLNALLGVPLLPTGITPVTAIPTFVREASSPSLRVEFEGAGEPFYSRNESDFPSILARYVSEAENPDNRAKVRRVELAVNTARLGDSVILVDTPGVGSTFVHNTRTAEAVLTDCDVGVFVVSADPPITEVRVGLSRQREELDPEDFLRPQQGRPFR